MQPGCLRQCDQLVAPVHDLPQALGGFPFDHDTGNGGDHTGGGSNGSPERLLAANAHAARAGMQGFGILNNNLSLAVMERPVWAGCLTSNSPRALAMLRETQMVHLSWSSQARGCFLPPARHRCQQPEHADQIESAGPIRGVRPIFSDHRMTLQRFLEGPASA
jgi:hypothetical protein